MPDQPFEHARRAVEHALRGIEQHRSDAHAFGQRAIADALAGVARGLERAGPAADEVRRAIEAVRKGGNRGGGNRGPRRKPGGTGPSPQPAPVHPNHPSTLSGGAEAPLDP